MRTLPIIFLVLIAICPTAVSAAKPPKLTPLEIQALQTREFETSKSILFASVMSVLQDLGYTVDSADMDTGFIKGASPVDNSVNFWEVMGGQTSARNSRVTAFVEQMHGDRARVRLNFVNSKKNSSWYGQSSEKDTPVLDPKTYQIAWDKIDEAVFIRRASTESKPAETQPADIRNSEKQ